MTESNLPIKIFYVFFGMHHPNYIIKILTGVTRSNTKFIHHQSKHKRLLKQKKQNKKGEKHQRLSFHIT